MKKILLPTNFSQGARNAARYAMRLFRDDQPKFHLLNAYALPLGSTSVQVAALQGGIGVEAKKSLIEDQHRFTREVSVYGASFTTASEFGTASKVILKYAERHQIDFVVMGNKRGNNYRKLFSGSHTQEVINKSSCPIIAIPEATSYRIPKNLLFLPDLKQDLNKDRLTPLLEIAEKFDSRITVMYLQEKYPTGQTRQHLGDLKQQLGDFFQDFYPLPKNNLEAGLDQFLSANDIDLLVLQGKNSFLKSMFRKWDSRKSASFSDRPLLAIRN